MKIARVEIIVLNLPMLIAIHCIAAMPGESLVERFYCDFAENPFGAAIDPKHGRIGVPQGPGLGVDPDPRLLEKLRIT
jgi:L-alanine-DL-glutamate epimerase-like enolase superfamily enzyme